MIIEDADHFGLSQLYQIRGRVGRRNRIGYCYLMIEPNKELTEAAEKRLKSIKEFTQLGSGYKIAMRDLTIRGAGDLLGPQQSGFIDQVGLDMYLDLLSEAIARKKGEAVPEKKEEKKAAVSMSGYIPAKFTDNDGDKLALYQEIKSLNSEEDITKYKNRVEDLFGRIPLPIQQLFNQRKVDIFANKEEVYDIHETMNQIIIEMSPAFSQSCNGEKLFNEITKISRMILLKLNKGKITITIPKQNKKYEDLLVKVVDVLQEKFL
jgi:transcription-repair coupling factor (superfamily II helicase)